MHAPSQVGRDVVAAMCGFVLAVAAVMLLAGCDGKPRARVGGESFSVRRVADVAPFVQVAVGNAAGWAADREANSKIAVSDGSQIR